MSCTVTVIMVRYSVKVFGECYGNGRWGVGEGGNVWVVIGSGVKGVGVGGCVVI